MKEKEPTYYYYYLRDEIGSDYQPPKHMKKEKALGFPRITVCIGVVDNDDGTVALARGMSLCSPSESVSKISKAYGRGKATGLAKKAFLTKKSTENVIRMEAFEIISKAVVGSDNENLIHPVPIEKFFKYRSAYQPGISNFEAGLIESKRK